jgi:hypothetical protein
VRSASALLVLALLALAGCDTTQRIDQRYALRAQRTLASRHALPVLAADPDVAVVAVTRLRGAAVVTLRNRSSRPLADVPLLLRAGGRWVNRRANLDYFQTHVASIAPGATVRWVFAGRIPRGRLRAVAGAPERRADASALPALRASAVAAGAGVRAVVANHSSIPQYNLPLYATAERGGRVVAAGFTTLEDLDRGASLTLELPLRGDARGASVRLEATPTILR